ncbi:MAG: rhodanese [Firmicutes bacterium HGW-Firmicutes-12]|jgi:thiosulfate/3-mercaptopyruvate sulfurtransferase|nr:MAG: rhodanese [Firmicutes bacterium HGW-Firmicutes-12]
MKRSVSLLLFVMIITIAFSLTGCGSTGGGAQGQEIIEAQDVAKSLGKENVVLVDMQNEEDYAENHIKGAINITRAEIVINEPVANMLAPKEQIEALLSAKGIGTDSTVIIYDNTNNMDAARLWWTLKVYGHENAQVVSGGWVAMKDTGIGTTDEVPSVTATNYSISTINEDMIASLEEVKAQVNDPAKNVVILDTRSQEEYDEGRIPGAILMNYLDNNFSDGTYKPVQHIKIQYQEMGVTTDKTIIMYCKTSVRAAQTYLALYNAGYRNLKVYDGAWLEWTSHSELPVQMPTGKEIEPSPIDMS